MIMKAFLAFTIAALAIAFQGCENRIVPKTTWDQQVYDSSISNMVKTALLNEPGIRNADISIETVTGTVTLSGSVPSEAQLKRVFQIVSSVEGVKSIYNRLSVKQGSTRILVRDQLITV